MSGLGSAFVLGMFALFAFACWGGFFMPLWTYQRAKRAGKDGIPWGAWSYFAPTVVFLGSWFGIAVVGAVFAGDKGALVGALVGSYAAPFVALVLGSVTQVAIWWAAGRSPRNRPPRRTRRRGTGRGRPRSRRRSRRR